jgi:hypothetical protein
MASTSHGGDRFRLAAQVQGRVGPYSVPDSTRSVGTQVGCQFSGGVLRQIHVPAPKVQEESRFLHSFSYQYVKWTAEVQVKEGGSWLTVASSQEQTAKPEHNGHWTVLPAIRPFSGGALGGSNGSAYRVVDLLKWLNPGVKGQDDGQVTYVVQHYHYNYRTSRRSDCQDRAPTSATAPSATISLGGDDTISVTGNDPDGDTPLTLKVLGATVEGSSVTGLAGMGGPTSIALYPTSADVGQTITVQYQLTDPGGATSGIQTLTVTVAGAGAQPTTSPSPVPTVTVTATPTPTPTTPTPTGTPTPTSAAPATMAAPTVSDHSGIAGLDGEIQVSYVVPEPNSGTISEIDYALNGTSTSGSLTTGAVGASLTKTIAGLTNGTPYTIAVRACNTASVCGSWSAPSATATPYTVPGKPSISASANGLTITYSWSGGGGGGRPLGHYNVCAAGTCSARATAGSATYAAGAYSTGYSFTAAYVDSAGQTSTTATASATSGTQPVHTPPPPYSETTGSVAHTWTNYANAGGTEGPEIGSNQSVSISCKIAGFRVADGNTWWYRIASSPWNNSYYVSADAFYNNGATSGSLVGTPFDDPSVPNC